MEAVRLPFDDGIFCSHADRRMCAFRFVLWIGALREISYLHVLLYFVRSGVATNVKTSVRCAFSPLASQISSAGYRHAKEAKHETLVTVSDLVLNHTTFALLDGEQAWGDTNQSRTSATQSLQHVHSVQL